MSKKYVIKNCPAIYGDEYCKENTYEDGSIHCQDCTDCTMKKIVEECNNAKMRANDYARNPYSGGIYDEANRILKLLDIEECR